MSSDAVLLTTIFAIFVVLGTFLAAVLAAITTRLESDRRQYNRVLDRFRYELEQMKPLELREREARQRRLIEERNRRVLAGDGV